eukprot:3571449-Amphidinium_carterae.2
MACRNASSEQECDIVTIYANGTLVFQAKFLGATPNRMSDRRSSIPKKRRETMESIDGHGGSAPSLMHPPNPQQVGLRAEPGKGVYGALDAIGPAFTGGISSSETIARKNEIQLRKPDSPTEADESTKKTTSNGHCTAHSSSEKKIGSVCNSSVHLGLPRSCCTLTCLHLYLKSLLQQF